MPTKLHQNFFLINEQIWIVQNNVKLSKKSLILEKTILKKTIVLRFYCVNRTINIVHGANSMIGSIVFSG